MLVRALACGDEITTTKAAAAERGASFFPAQADGGGRRGDGGGDGEEIRRAVDRSLFRHRSRCGKKEKKNLGSGGAQLGDVERKQHDRTTASRSKASKMGLGPRLPKWG